MVVTEELSTLDPKSREEYKEDAEDGKLWVKEKGEDVCSFGPDRGEDQDNDLTGGVDQQSTYRPSWVLRGGSIRGRLAKSVT